MSTRDPEDWDASIRFVAGWVIALILLGLAFYVGACIDKAYFQWLSNP